MFLLWSAWLLGILIALSSLDDLFIDLSAHFRSFYRSRTVYRKSARARANALPQKKEGPIAILIPAWRESTVIGFMLDRLRSSMCYDNYRIFLGVYPNDPATAEAARKLDPDGRWLHILYLDHPGPTSKGDCLNMLWRHISHNPAYPYFQQFVLHDAEDVVHPDELRLFNFLVDRADMIQLPVIPLPSAYHSLVGGHYLDEFAESHQKDMVLREWLVGGVPSAGVGCAFSRRALEEAAARSGNCGPFPQHSLTEDYELAMTLLRLGRRSIFVRLSDSDNGQMVVATREYFPTGFSAAVRQKARWMIGIALQSWESQGWHGSKTMRYMLFRDRKTLLTSLLTFLAYILGLSLFLITLFSSYDFLGKTGLTDPDGALIWLFWLNMLLLANRIAHRAVYTGRLYGWRHGALSFPRIIVGNMVNSAAAIRAIRLYFLHKLFGRPLHWVKTEHKFPTGNPGS